ncbi:uncharacterized protein LOC135226669 [Macrobrachium nipponense]|uniref:uncharacterized protein LOC135226669 n=1 Tax=Macrobrachium nipponense TaxID=159736 RepID=UPI0030C8C7A5
MASSPSPSSSPTKPSPSKTMMTRRRTRSAGSSPDDNSPKIQRPRLHSPKALDDTPPQTNKQPLLPFPTMDSSDDYDTHGNDDNDYQQECTTKPICGVCSGKHPTSDCIDSTKRRKEATTARCPNCRKGHHAWYKGCMERLKRIWNMKGSPSPKPTESTKNSHNTHPTTSHPTTLPTQQEPQRDLAKQWQHPIQQHTHKPPQSHRPQHYQQTHKTGPQSQKTQHHQPPTQTQKQQATPTKPHENRDPRLTEGTLYTQRNTQVPNARPTSFLPYSTPNSHFSPPQPIPPKNMPSSTHPVHESNTRTGRSG